MNMVVVGVDHPPAGKWPVPPYTEVARTPIVREKPFLQVSKAGEFSFRVPALFPFCLPSQVEILQMEM